MRWYHYILCYMIVIGALALGAIGDQLGGLFVFCCIAAIVLGVLGVKYLPMDKSAL